MDTALLLETDWYDPAHFHFGVSKSYIFKDGHYMKFLQQSSVNYTLTQPDNQSSHECTAAMMAIKQNDYPWMTIPCHKKLYASYFCQPLELHVDVPRPPASNIRCDRDWLLPRGSENCFLVLDSGENKISYYDSEHVCSIHNASVFKVNISKQNYVANENNKDLKSHLMYGMPSSDQSLFNHLYPDASSVSIKTMLFGRRLENSGQSMLPFFLQKVYMATYELAASMVFFTDHNNTCSIVEFLDMSNQYRDPSYLSDGLGVKCRPCAEKINVSGIICEKPAYINEIKCAKTHFQCHDQTCILSIYKCDQTHDCFDHSDEADCMNNNVGSKLIGQFVKLPCLPNSDCDTDTGKQIRVHDVCDGIVFDDTFLREKDICMTTGRKMILPISKDRQVKEKGSTSFRPRDLAMLFWHEYKYKCSKINSSRTSAYDSFFKGKPLKQNTKLNNICLIRGRKHRCQSPKCRLTCAPFTCPGMFQCSDHVCIPLSYYCDKIVDCVRGEDESMCLTSTPVCPGYLKCRGETKCISTDELCDNKLNCFNSMDDEFGCDICPVNCECKGYVMTCHSNNTHQIVEGDKVFYTKGLLINGTQQLLITKNLNLIGLLFLNISQCELDKVDVSYDDKTQLFFLIFADFSRNKLTTTLFLRSQIFRRTVFLDLSFNLLHTFTYGRSLSLTYLSVLCLTGNNFKEIRMTIADGHLVFINLQFIYYYPEIAFRIDHDRYFDILVAVTDSQLCCLFSDHVKCLSNQDDVICYGILNYISTKVAFYCLSLFSMFVSLCLPIEQALKIISRDKKSKNKNYNSILLMNQSVSNILGSLYLITLFAMDIIKIQLLFFKISIACVLLNAILYISLESIIIFKSSLSLLIALKIRFPFRHQCTWLKWVIPASGFVWLFVMTTYIIRFFLSLRETSDQIFDNLCSIVGCEMYINFNMLLGMMYFIDQFSICIYIFSFLLTYTSLKNHREHFKSATSGNTFSAGGVACKCILANILEITNRVYLITLLSVQLSHLGYVHFCLSFFIYALPINILFSGFVNVFK